MVWAGLSSLFFYYFSLILNSNLFYIHFLFLFLFPFICTLFPFSCLIFHFISFHCLPFFYPSVSHFLLNSIFISSFPLFCYNLLSICHFSFNVLFLVVCSFFLIIFSTFSFIYFHLSFSPSLLLTFLLSFCCITPSHSLSLSISIPSHATPLTLAGIINSTPCGFNPLFSPPRKRHTISWYMMRLYSNKNLKEDLSINLSGCMCVNPRQACLSDDITDYRMMPRQTGRRNDPECICFTY